MRLLGEKVFCDPRQDIRVGDTLARVVESWRVDDDHCAAGGTVSEANRHDVRRLGFEGVADGDAGLAREEVDEL